MRKQSLLVLLSLVLLLSIIASSVVYAAQSSTAKMELTPPPISQFTTSYPKKNRPSHCVELQMNNDLIGANTPTPEDGQKENLSEKGKILPTMTPIPYKKVFDLDQKLPLTEKASLIILRCDGTLELVLFNPSEDPLKRITLAEGDEIIASMLPDSIQKRNINKEQIATAAATIMEDDYELLVTATEMPYPPS